MSTVRERLRPKEHWGKKFFSSNKVPQSYIAHYLNITPERMSRILNGIVPCPQPVEDALLELRDQILLEEAEETK